MLFSCKKDDTTVPETKESIKQSASYTKLDTGSWVTYETQTFYMDTTGVQCAQETHPEDNGFIFVILSDTTFELKNHLAMYLGGGKFTFSTSTGELVIPDGIYAITAPRADAGGNSIPGYLENTKVYYNNEKILQSDNVSVTKSSANTLYMDDIFTTTQACGRTTYTQNRLHK